MRSKMSRSSPCCGARPCCSTKRWISSKPATMRSSRSERPPFFAGWANSSSSARRSSSSLITSLVLVANERRGTFGHALFPRIGRAHRRQAPAILLELHGTDGQLLGFIRRQVGALAGDCCSHLLQAVLAHALGEDGVGLAERVDTVDQVDVQLAHIHCEAAHAIDQRRVGGWLAVLFFRRQL